MKVTISDNGKEFDAENDYEEYIYFENGQINFSTYSRGSHSLGRAELGTNSTKQLYEVMKKYYEEN